MTDEEVKIEVARMVRESNVSAVARAMGLPSETVARLAGGLTVRAGTLALARERLSRGAR